MAENLQGLDYFLDSDAWQDTDVADWAKVDAYVDNGWLTEQDRDYLHAYASMVALNPDSAGGFKETDAAWEKYLDVNKEHKNDPLFDGDTKAGDIPPPDFDDGPQDGKDYYQDTPGGLDGLDEEPIPDVPKVPGDEGDGKVGKDVIKVNTKALKVFADNVDELRTMINGAKVKTDEVHILPGGFTRAFMLRDKIQAESGENPGLKNSVRDYMDQLEIVLENIRDEVRKLVVDYDNTEDLNKLTTDKLNSVMSDSFDYIGGLTGSGSGS